MKYLPVLGMLLVFGCTRQAALESPKTANSVNTVTVRQGNLAKRNGTATVRKEFDRKADDPKTKNDESNDQPLGHFGSLTVYARNIRSGRAYPLDADVGSSAAGYELRRLYFAKGGWVDFTNCVLDDKHAGLCSDENGREWEVTGSEEEDWDWGEDFDPDSPDH